MSNLALTEEYGKFIESTMLDEEAFNARLSRYITDESVLVEPEGLFGRLVGFEGWNQWRRAAAGMAERTGVAFSMGGDEYYENGDRVVHYYEIDFSARPSHPDGWKTSVLERFEFVDGKIATLTAYYADTTAFEKFLA